MFFARMAFPDKVNKELQAKNGEDTNWTQIEEHILKTVHWAVLI